MPSTKIVATSLATASDGGSFLLELLHYAGWQLQVRDGRLARIRASRDGVEIDVTGSTFAEAAGVAFARAMRSGRHGPRSGGS